MSKGYRMLSPGRRHGDRADAKGCEKADCRHQHTPVGRRLFDALSVITGRSWLDRIGI